MARRKQSRRAKHLRCEHLEPRLVLSTGLGLAAEPLLHSPGTSRFDGVDDMLTFEDRPEMNTNEYTISLWFKADDLTGTQSLIARGEDWNKDKAQWVVELNDAAHPGKVQLWYEETNDADHYFASQSTIEADRWYHFAATRTAAGQVTIYVDGQQELQRTDTRPPASVPTPVVLGARLNAPGQMQDYFDGALREVMVFGEVMSAEAIDQLMDQTRPTADEVSDPIAVSTPGEFADVAINADGSFVTVWHETVGQSDDIFAQRFDSDGTPLGQRIAVNTTTPGNQHEPAVALQPNGSFVVVWASQGSGSETIQARLFDAQGQPTSGELLVGQHPDAEWAHPDVAMDGQGNFVVVWNGHWNSEGVLARRFDRTGNPLSQALRVDDGAHTGYGYPKVAMNEAGWFAIASPRGEWITTDLLTYDPSGILVSTSMLDTRYESSLAINDDGLFVVSWIGDYPDQPQGDLLALYAQIYSVQGYAVGPRVLVTPGKAGGLDWNIYDSSVAMNGDCFVVTWKDYDFDANGYFGTGIYASRFDLEGRLLGAELQLDTMEQPAMLPAVSMNENAYVVAWQLGWGDGVVAKTVSFSDSGAVAMPEPLLSIGPRQEFDGVDDKQSVDQANLNINQYTIGFWFKADDPGHGEQALIARGEDWATDKAQWVVQLNADQNPGKLQLWYEDAADRDAYFASKTTIAPGLWYYATVTRSSDGLVQVFVNGALELSARNALVPVSRQVPVLLGARTNAPNKTQDYFDGSMQGVTVFDQVLSPLQINRLMRESAPETPPQPTGPIYEHADPIELNGVNQYVSIDDPALNTTVYTIALSFKADNPGRRTQSLIARGEDWATDKAQWVLEINDANSPGKLQLWYEDSKDNDHYFAAPTTIEAGKWYNAIVTRSADGMVRIYVDGQQVYQKLDAVGPATAANAPVLIGARTNQPRLIQDYFDGTIQNVQVYNYAMTPAQVVGIVPAPRLELSQPVDGQVYQDGQIDLALTTDRPLTELTYSIDGVQPVSLIEDKWVYQENPDSAVARSLNIGDVVFEYAKPQYAVGARWQYSYSTAAGTFTAVDDLPQAAWNYDADKVSTRVVYPSSITAPVCTQYNTGTWQNWQELGLNNPGGSYDSAAALYDGNWSTGAAYHAGARQWLTLVAAETTFVKFNEEAIVWNVHLVEDAVQRTIDVAPGVHTMTVTGTDTLGKTSSLTVTFTVEAPVIDVNGDFETGELGPWTLTDSGAVVTADLFTPNIAPAGGDYMGYITTGLNELPSDLHFVDIDGNGDPEREYSALSVEVNLPSAAMVDVDLNFLTSEIYDGVVGGSDLLVVTTGAITDTSAYKLFFAIADSSYTGSATPLTPSMFSDEFIQDNPYGRYPTIADSSVFNGQTGFKHYSFALDAGIQTLTFFVADSYTDGGATAMLIDNLVISLVA